MNKKTIWLILAIYSLISIIGALTSGEAGAVNLAAVAGVIVAMIFYTRRYVPEKSAFVKKTFTAIALLATIASIIVAVIFSKEGMMGNIISNIGSGACTVIIILIANSKKFEFMETCERKTFIIILLVCLLVLPSVMLMVSGIVSFVLAIVLVIAFAGVMFSNLGGFLSSVQTQRTVFRDNKGYEHATAFDRDKANDSYKENQD